MGYRPPLLLGRKRPITASRRNQAQFGQKKSFGLKNPSTLDLDGGSRLKTRFIN